VKVMCANSADFADDVAVLTEMFSALILALVILAPDVQSILRQSYNYLTIMPKLRSTYDGHLIYQTSYEGHKAFLGYNLLAKS